MTLVVHDMLSFAKPAQCMQLPTRVLEVELTLASSNHHVEMNPSDVGNNDRYVVQEILKVCQQEQYVSDAASMVMQTTSDYSYVCEQLVAQHVMRNCAVSTFCIVGTVSYSQTPATAASIDQGCPKCAAMHA